MGDESEKPIELPKLIRCEDRQGALERRATQAGELVEKLFARPREPALDDAAVVRPMPPLEEPVPFDALDDPGRPGVPDVVHVRDAAHRERPISPETV